MSSTSPVSPSAAQNASAEPAPAAAEGRTPNRLIHEKSPYLLQHAYNPVDWHPWGEEAFRAAHETDRMLLVSIGYATCHWCHVMERESFTDAQLAAYLNTHFVPVKVDREERPEVDRVYMEALQALGEPGGWPLNMFATPDGRPVFGGTYFPPQERYGRKSFRQVLEALARAWREQREDVFRNAEALTEHLRSQHVLSSSSAESWTRAPIEQVCAQYTRLYDAQYGGFRLQPQNKFPPSMGLMLLLREHVRTKDAQLLQMVEGTVKGILAGGIYDQLGGGMSRYSTDERWLVPHFEKMLYDNALFVQLLSEMHLAAGKTLYRSYAEDVLDYVLREMRTEEGAFHAAEDADSEGGEGRYYLWTPQEVRTHLPTHLARCALAYWQITPEGNFEGRNVLHTPETLSQVAQGLELSPADLAQHLQEARTQLLAVRAQREKPFRDDKILSCWNALMVSALARAGCAWDAEASENELRSQEFIAAAEACAEFLWTRLRDAKGRLLRRYRENEARFAASLSDYALFGLACLDCYQASFRLEWFQRACTLALDIERLFQNPTGPYYDTGADTETFITRSMDGHDGVEPSGNSAAAMLFLRLAAYGVQEQRFTENALRIFGGFHRHLREGGLGMPCMLCALDFHLGPVRQIAIVGAAEDPATRALLRVVRKRFLPASVIAQANPEDLPTAAEQVPLLRERTLQQGRPTAYVCESMACRLPVHDAQALQALLESGSR